MTTKIRVQQLPTHSVWVAKCYCRECGEDDEWIVKYKPDEAVDCAIKEFSSAARFLVTAELQLEHAHQLYRQTNFRLLRLSRRLKQGSHLSQYGRLRIGIATRCKLPDLSPPNDPDVQQVIKLLPGWNIGRWFPFASWLTPFPCYLLLSPLPKEITLPVVL